MKKVLVINGSPRKGRTYKLLKNIADKLPYEVEFVNLKDYNINECLGCEVCIKKDVCVIKDEAESLMKKMVEADGLVIGTPVYIENVSGLLKKFLDRTCRWHHRPPLIGKPVLLVSTTAGSSLNEVLNYLENIFTTWGAIPCGKIGRSAAQSKTVTDKELKKFIDAMENKIKTSYVNLKRLMRFQVQKAMATNLLEIDRKYWENNNLISKNYYYKFYTDPFSFVFSTSFGKFLSKKIRENAKKAKTLQQTE